METETPDETEQTTPAVTVTVDTPEPVAEEVAPVIVETNDDDTDRWIQFAERLTRMEQRQEELYSEVISARSAADTATATAEVASEIAIAATEEVAEESAEAEPEPEPEPVTESAPVEPDEEPKRDHWLYRKIGKR